MKNATTCLKRKVSRISILILLLASLMTFANYREVTAADTTKPTIKLTQSTKAPTNEAYRLYIQVTDASGLSSVKWASGSRTASYFSKSGYTIKLNASGKTYRTIKKNGIYSFYAKDKAGNSIVKKITITNIDTVKPVISIKQSNTAYTNRNVKLTLTLKDEGQGIVNLKYLVGKKYTADFKNAGKELALTEVDLVKNSYNSQYTYTATLWVKSNQTITFLTEDSAGNKTLKRITISNIDKVAPIVQLDYSVMNQKATIKTLTKDADSGIKNVTYLKGKITDVADTRWKSRGIDVTKEDSFKVTSSGNYSVLAQDNAGNQTIQVIAVELEFRAVWISYLEFLETGKGGFTKDKFEQTIDTMFDNVVSMNMNAVVVQVRPFGDAMYDSKYFPWSKYISGTQGVNPGFDPLTYMVEAAHARGLELHAWLNPYRVTTASTDYTTLSKDNPARIWYEDSDESNDRNVLSYGGNLYYNPASKEVQNLIVNGIEEIVDNYDVDGIHFDDYFYPTLGSGYENKFDNLEYEEYVTKLEASGKAPLSIADWRRNNINKLIKDVYSSIKEINSAVQFGISPAGYYNTLLSDTAYYTDIKTWLSSDGYIDYICPQIYWTFSHSSYPYDKTLDQWLAYRTSSTVKVYVGIATYRAGSSLESDWKYDVDVLKNQVEYGRDTGLVDGFIFFRYNFFINNKTTAPGVNKLLEIL